MTKTRAARILSLILALTLVFACMSPSSYAISKQQFGAWIAAALQAINITATATATATADASRDLMDWLSYPAKVVASQFVDVPYTTPLDKVDEYLSRSTLEIDKDIVTIDGVPYTDIWLSNEASEKFRVNAFDLENAFDIASKSEGTFVSGAGTFQNIPLYSFTDASTGTTSLRSQYVNVAPSEETIFPFGNTYVTLLLPGYPNSSRPTLKWEINGNTSQKYSSFNTAVDSNYNYQVRVYNSTETNPNQRAQLYCFYTNSGQNNASVSVFNTGSFDATPFDFDWVAGTIPADEVLPSDEGLRIRVPTEEIDDWYTQYPGTAESVTINMGDPELEAKVDDLIDLIIPLIPMLDIDFTKNETPSPDPDPDPKPEPKPWDDILSGLRNIFDNITIGNAISQGIKNVADSISSKLDDIKTGIGDIANKIERGTADWFRDIVQSIWQPFLPIFNIFRSGVGIWHYVVEWLQYIHEPFVTFWNFLGSAGYIFLSPIYATAAAAIVIAIYRRFGR